MEHKIKLNTYLSFDSEKEADLIEKIDSLSSKKQLSYFVTNIIKFALENPVIIEKANITTNGYLSSKDRLDFFKGITTEVKEIEKKLTYLQEMVEHNYNLILLNKSIGLSGKTENEVLASFIIERELQLLKVKLGIQNLVTEERSQKLSEYHEKSEKLVEDIITKYDGIITELVNRNISTSVITENSKQSVEHKETVVTPVPQVVQNQAVVSIDMKEDINNEVELSEEEYTDLDDFFS